jgi:adenosylcobinamide-phosphate synthase
MRLEYQLAAAVILDACLGDPLWLPHPVRWIGRYAAWLEPQLRRWVLQEKASGILAVLVVLGTIALAAWGLLSFAGRIHPWAADAAAIWIMYTTFAARDLITHSRKVYTALAQNDLPAARARMNALVGRDTQDLDATGVTRAAVESVAESTVDGVTAPLFYALLFGPVGAIVYRGINTLDSLFGHLNERYTHFGWAAAKLDDAANYVPARLTAPLVSLAALCLGQRAGNALRILRRDGRKHASPNAGLSEAAMAGALGVQLGGLNFYAGEAYTTPTLGDPLVPLAPKHIVRANALMLATMVLFLIFGLGLRAYAAKPLRIVSAAPSVTEILFELGMGNSLVGVTTSCDYPEQAKHIERIGQFNQPNMEKILSLSPTLLIAANANLGAAEDTLKQAGIQVINVKIGNFNQLFAGILQIGQAAGAEARAQALVARLQNELASVAGTYQSIPQTQRPKVFVELWYNPLTTAGGSAFLNEVIARAGGINAAQAIRNDYPQVNPEDVMAWNPDVILIARMLPSQQALQEIRNRIGWDQIRAVQQDRIITGISSDYLLRPGPRLVLGVRQLTEALYVREGKNRGSKK